MNILLLLNRCSAGALVAVTANDFDRVSLPLADPLTVGYPQYPTVNRHGTAETVKKILNV